MEERRRTDYRYQYYVCFSRHPYGTQECDQDRLRAEELEERVVESLQATLERGDLLEEAPGEWTVLAEMSRPKREKELAWIEARIRKAATALDRYFLAFEGRQAARGGLHHSDRGTLQGSRFS